MKEALAYKLTVTIPGKPVPCPRPRVSKNGTYYPASYMAWQEMAHVLLRDECVKRRGGKMFERRVGVEVRFFGAHGSADLDNLVKSVLDAAQGAVFVNDRQVYRLEAAKFGHVKLGKPYTLVQVWEVLA